MTLLACAATPATVVARGPSLRPQTMAVSTGQRTTQD